jgi:hypothetical protein
VRNRNHHKMSFVTMVERLGHVWVLPGLYLLIRRLLYMSSIVSRVLELKKQRYLVLDHSKAGQVLLSQLLSSHIECWVRPTRWNDFKLSDVSVYTQWIPEDALDPCSDPAYSTTTSFPLNALSKSVILPPEESSSRKRRRSGSG